MSVRDRVVDSPASPALEWQSADASTRVSVPFEVVDQITGFVVEAYKAVPRRGAECGGVLVGQTRLGTVTNHLVTGFQPIPCEHLLGPSFVLSPDDDNRVRELLAKRPANSVLGYYRSHTRKEPGLDQSDREMVARLFAGKNGIVLLLKPSGMLLTGEIYFFRNGRIDNIPAGPEFPFRGAIPGGILPHESAPPAPALPVQEPLVFPSPVAVPAPRLEALPEPAPPRPRKNLHWEIFAAAVMIAAAFALLYWQYYGDAGGRITGLAQAPVPTRAASLGLSVRPGGGAWRVTWNADSPEVRTATGGALDVADDNSRARIPLSASEIRRGLATYRPNGSDVTFRLEIDSNRDILATETYRIFEKEVVRPAPPPAAPKKQVAEQPKQEERYTPPEVLERVSPQVGEGIRTRIASPMTIDVRVHIAKNGLVTDAVAIQHVDGLVDYLGARAVAAAKEWTFTPAKQGSEPIESTRVIHFVFEQ